MITEKLTFLVTILITLLAFLDAIKVRFLRHYPWIKYRILRKSQILIFILSLILIAVLNPQVEYQRKRELEILTVRSKTLGIELEKQKKLTEQARQQTLESQRELAKLRIRVSWRSIPHFEKQSMITQLSPFSGEEVLLSYKGYPESIAFVEQLLEIFQKASLKPNVATYYGMLTLQVNQRFQKADYYLVVGSQKREIASKIRILMKHAGFIEGKPTGEENIQNSNQILLVILPFEHKPHF